MSEQRKTHHDPPDRYQKKSQSHGCFHGKTDFVIKKNKNEAQDKGDAASDISPCIALGGNFISTVFRGYIRKHGVVNYEAQRVGGFCNNKKQQEPEPRLTESKKDTADSADQKSGKKYFFSPSFCVRGCSHDGTQNGNNDCGHRDCVAPVGKIIYFRDPCLICKIVEINGHDGGNQKRKGRISHIVQDPFLFHTV